MKGEGEESETDSCWKCSFRSRIRTEGWVQALSLLTELVQPGRREQWEEGTEKDQPEKQKHEETTVFWKPERKVV